MRFRAASWATAAEATFLAVERARDSSHSAAFRATSARSESSLLRIVSCVAAAAEAEATLRRLFVRPTKDLEPALEAEAIVP